MIRGCVALSILDAQKKRRRPNAHADMSTLVAALARLHPASKDEVGACFTGTHIKAMTVGMNYKF